MEKSISLKLDRNSVISVSRPIFAACSDNTISLLQLLSTETGKFKNEHLNEINFTPYIFEENSFESSEEKRNRLINWVLKKGFEELLNGVFIGFKEAFIYTSIVKENYSLKTYGDFKKALKKFQNDSESFNLPKFLSKLNNYLTNLEEYTEALKSINKVRNCLVHRNGQITVKDINNKEKQSLDLKYKYISTYGDINDKKESKIIDNEHLRIAKNVILKQEFSSKSYVLGGKIIISPLEFYGISYFCNDFMVELTKNLPTKPLD